MAVDNVLLRLGQAKDNLKMVRLGHPSRVEPRVLKYSMDSQVASREESAIVQDVIDELASMLARKKGGREKWMEVRLLRKEVKKRQRKIAREVVGGSSVVLSTNVGASRLTSLGSGKFDVLIIDEAGQGLEASCWIPMQFAPKLVLAGDYKQLPPTVMNDEALEGGLAYTLLDRVVDLEKSSGVRLSSFLDTQYRMNSKIMEWSSQRFYEGRLVAGESVKDLKLGEGVGIEEEDKEGDSNLLNELVWCDTNDLGMEEITLAESKLNLGEIGLVANHLAYLLSSGLVQEKEIGVITPYNAQKHALQEALNTKYPEVEIKSVDGFQGREKQVIILSLVRSNQSRSVGFLKDERRMNVSITRAKKQVYIVGDSLTLSSDPCLASLYDYVEARGYIQIVDPNDLQEVYEVSSLPGVQGRSEEKKKSSQSQQTKRERHQKVGEEQRKRDDERVVKEVQVFLESSKAFLRLSPDLNSWQRQLVHATVDKYNEGTSLESVEHVSRDHKGTRCLEMTRYAKGIKGDFTERVAPREVQDLDDQTGSLVRRTQEEKSPLSTRDKVVLHAKKKAESKLQEIDREEQKRLLDEENALKARARAEAKQKEEEAVLEKERQDLLLIEKAIKKNKRCALRGCKTNVEMVHYDCKFCTARYCITHAQQEVHGCELKVRNQRDVLPMAHKRALQGRLSSKIASKVEARKAKPKKKKKRK